MFNMWDKQQIVYHGRSYKQWIIAGKILFADLTCPSGRVHHALDPSTVYNFKNINRLSLYFCIKQNDYFMALLPNAEYQRKSIITGLLTLVLLSISIDNVNNNYHVTQPTEAQLLERDRI